MDFEQNFEQACKPGPDRILAGAVLGAADKSGNTYLKSFGTAGVASNAEPLKEDAVMWIASCTKLLTSIAMLQCVERGLFGLDDDATELIPELGKLQVFSNTDLQNLQVAPRKNKITPRILASHTSGLAYEFITPQINAWKTKETGTSPTASRAVFEDYLDPLMFEPGTSWLYSPGLDFVGKMVERTNGNVSLGEYMRKHIFEPLGMQSTTFRLSSSPELRKRVMPMTNNAGTGSLEQVDALMWPEKPVDDLGGAGLWSTAPDYLKVLTSILANDGKLLKTESVDILFQPAMSDPSHLTNAIYNPQFASIAVPGYPELKWNQSIAGIVLEEEAPKRHGKGTLTWGGLPNLVWSIDREAGIASFFATQLTPPGHPSTIELKKAFEEGLLQAWAKN